MQRTLVFLTALASATKAATLDLESDMIFTDHQTFYGFNVAATAEPTESTQHDAFINACLTSSYNSINDPTKYYVKTVIPETETIVVAPPSADNSINNLEALPLSKLFFRPWRSLSSFNSLKITHPARPRPFTCINHVLLFLDTFRFYIFANLVTATCRGCNPDNDPRRLMVGDFDLFGEWESAFCTCLQSSTDAVLHTASECAIERPTITGARTTQRIAEHNEVAKPSEATNDMVFSNRQTFYGFNVAATAEPMQSTQHDAFINACLTSSYNSINDPTKYYVKTVIPEAETIVDAPSSADNSINNLDALPLSKSFCRPWQCLSSFNYLKITHPARLRPFTFINHVLLFLDTFRFYIFANLVTATCRGCNPDNDPRRLLVGDFDLFGEWESAFCTCLQSSTDAVLHTASECAIERPAITGARTKQRIAEHNEVAKPSEATNDMVFSNRQTFYGFNVAATAEPTQSSQHDAFINACLTSSYNSINDPTKYYVKTVIPEAETIVDAPSSADNLEALPMSELFCRPWQSSSSFNF
jgi:hypothetical protein